MAERAAHHPSLMLEAMVATLRAHLPDLEQRYLVTYLGVFGSYVRGAQRRRSDVDILVEFRQAPTLFTFIDLQDELSALLGMKVDLVMKSALRPTIGKRVLEEVVPV